ncbi:MAG: D-alanine--D-alanine ligase [Bacteroidota bacterium]|mgnify:CR=1 FL=1
MKIAVFLGGSSPEREVSLASGKAVAIALKSKGHSVLLFDPALGDKPLEIENILPDGIHSQFPNEDELKKLSPKNYIDCVESKLLNDVDLVFLTLHGQWGEDGRIQSLLEFRGIKYTGSKVMSSALTMDKAITKILLKQNGIETAEWLTAKNNFDLQKIIFEINLKIGYPLVVKPNDQGSTVGLTIVENENEIEKAILTALEFSSTALIEKFIPGRELTVAIIGEKVLPIIEIKPQGGFYDYAHKYTKGMTEYICPADLEINLAEKIEFASKKFFDICQCEGFARADFRLQDDGKFFALEINTLPGMTATSLVPKAAKAIGIEFPELCEMICKLTIAN